MNIDKPCHNSFCEPRLQNEGQKKLTDFTDAHGVFDTDFFDLCLLIYIWILNGFASMTACGCWENEEWRMKNVETTFGGRRESQWRMRAKKRKNFFSFFTLTPSLSAWNALFIGGSVVRATMRANFLPSHLPSHHNPSQIPFVLSRHNQNETKIKKKKIKKRIRVKTP